MNQLGNQETPMKLTKTLKNYFLVPYQVEKRIYHYEKIEKRIKKNTP